MKTLKSFEYSHAGARSGVLGIMIVAGLLGGCNQPREIKTLDIENEDYAMPADFRMVRQIPRKKIGETIVCPEPSPDAIAVVASSFAIHGGAQGLGGGGAGGGTAEAAASLFARSQAIQAARDTVTAACWNYQNGLIDEFGYQVAMATYPDLLLGALAVEGLTDRPLHLPGGVASGAVGVSTSGSYSSGQGTDSQDAQNKTEIPGSDPVAFQGLSSPSNRVNFDASAIKAMESFVTNLFEGERIFKTACMLHLANSKIIKMDDNGNLPADTKYITIQCHRLMNYMIEQRSAEKNYVEVKQFKEYGKGIDERLKGQKSDIEDIKDIEDDILEAVGESFVEILVDWKREESSK